MFFITLELYVRRPVPDRPATESTPEGKDSGQGYLTERHQQELIHFITLEVFCIVI
jgi:hypothetical protein